ncbi:hypothetical protein [Kocuria marina]|uniref:hypothetical protein n=1 Tax=Kocuria marina TaxID=223184 RepID=UPI0021B43241|nr:hypothetical protein [Kocuria indica]
MTSAPHPRDGHDPSDSPSQDAPSRGGARSPVPAPRERPTYGIRTTGPGDAQGPGGPQGSADRDTQSASGGTTAPGSAASPGSPTAAPSTGSPSAATPRLAASPSAEARAASSRAARRMGRGLSFTVVLLGLLVGLGLIAQGAWLGWVIGAVLTVAGVAGYALVQTRALPIFRDPTQPVRRAWSKLWLIPAALLLLGLGCIATAFVVPSWLGSSVPADLLDDYILAFIVGGMTMIVGAGLGFGLVATSRLTRPDDDDSPLRPTDYAERLRDRDRRDEGNYYDSDWIRHDPRD